MAFPVPAEVITDGEPTSSTTHSFACPATVNAGDRLLFSATVGHNTAAPSGGTLDGWTQIADDTRHTFDRRLVYEVEAVASSPGAGQALASALSGHTITVTTSTGNTSTGAVVRITGARSGGEGTAWDVSVGAWGGAQGTAPDPPSLAPTWGSDDNLWLTGVNHDASAPAATATPPANYSEIVDTGGGVGFALAIAERDLAATTDDPAAWTLSKTSWHSAFTLAYRPVAAGISVTPERAELALVARDAAVQVPVSVTPERAELALVARAPQPITTAPVTLAWPASGRLQVGLETALDHAGLAPPDWTWTDLGAWQVGSLSDLVIALTRGRADLAAEPEPGELATVLDASDGELMPQNPSSSLWPDWRRGVPIRQSVDAEVAALRLHGAGYAFTPHHTDFDITGDLDLRIHLEPDAWAAAAAYVNGGINTLPPERMRLISRWLATGDERSWNLTVWGVGTPFFEWSPDGTQGASLFNLAEVLVAALKPIWLASTIDVDDGSGNRVVTLWRSDAETPPADVTDWDVIQTWTTAGTTSLHAGTADLVIGTLTGPAGSFAGRILSAEIRNGRNGPLVANPDFTAQAPGTTGFVDGTGKAWVLAGDAEITRRQIRFVGNATALAPLWPNADHAAGIGLDDLEGRHPTEARVAVTASGLLRRLTQGASPLRSSLFRHVTSERYAGLIAAYWPGEDGDMASQLASGLAGEAAMLTTGLDMAADDSLPASAALPSIEAGEAATWLGTVADIGADSQWVVEWFGYLATAEANPTTTRLMTVHCAGDVATFHVDIHDVSTIVTALDPVGTQLDQSVTGHSGDMLGRWVLWRLEATQDGADVDYSLSFVDIDTGGGATVANDTVTGQTLGRVTSISGDTVGPPDGMSFGHIIVHGGVLAAGWLAGPDTAWSGESAARRFWRLCAEHGIPVEVIGDPAASTLGLDAGRGDLSASQAMGPQQRKTLVELLMECVEIDMGVLSERRAVPGLVFRCRHTIEDQAAALILDAAQGDVANPLDPTEDDGRLRNDVTVTSTGGSSARAVDQTSIDEAGRYDDAVEIAGVGGLDIQDAIVGAQDGLATAILSQNLQQASWRLTLGTTEGLRYPTLTIDFRQMSNEHARDMVDTWVQTALGDRVQVVNLPVQVPTEAVELIIEHITETITPTAWIVELTCSPGDPWLTGELVE